MASRYATYYSQQGKGISDIGRLYRLPVHHQRGSGIGGLFAAALKFLSPFAASGLSALKQQAIKTGKDILGDIGGTEPISDVFSRRGKEAVRDLSLKGIDKLKRTIASSQGGSGYIKRRRTMNSITLRKSRQRRNRRKTVRKVKKQIGGRRRRTNGRRRKTTRKKRTRTLDIFN